MNLPDFLIDHPDGEIRITGHRVGLYHIIDRYLEGDSPETLHEEFPTIALATIHKVIAFYLENEAQVDAYMAAYRAELARLEAEHIPSPSAERIRQKLENRSTENFAVPHNPA
jgi:uncharacterized protein (DUF433 family)